MTGCNVHFKHRLQLHCDAVDIPEQNCSAGLDLTKARLIATYKKRYLE